jgi:hypothetical protein
MALNVHAFVFSTKLPCFMAFTYCYWAWLNRTRTSSSECLKIAAAGSLTTHLVEMAFYFGDTINSRSKI